MNKTEEKSKFNSFRRQLFRMTSDGVVEDLMNQVYDVISTLALILNLTVVIMNTYQNMHEKYGSMFSVIESVTVAFFAVDYLLRLLAAKYQFPQESEAGAIKKYMTSFYGVIDFLSFVPYYLPVFFPAGATAFRMVRVIRILRLFRINEYFDSLNVITAVIVSKKQQLLSSCVIIIIMMVASSLCMYSVENAVQPEVFSNAFSGIWWSASTLLTVGYGDIYPVTSLGKLLGILISFLGVGLVAIPAGIISAGFVEQYQRFKKLSEYAEEEDISFIRVSIIKRDKWVGKKIFELELPRNMMVAAIQRGNENIMPKGDVEIKAGDDLIIASDIMLDDRPLNLKEIVLHKKNPWNGVRIADLNISRQSFIVMVKRGKKMIIPHGDLILAENDKVFLYSKLNKDNNIK